VTQPCVQHAYVPLEDTQPVRSIRVRPLALAQSGKSEWLHTSMVNVFGEEDA